MIWAQPHKAYPDSEQGWSHCGWQQQAVSTFVGMRQQQVAVSTDKEAHALPISIYRTRRDAESVQDKGAM